MGRPLVSIITPVLNRARTIGACLTSVASQTYQPIEHIVVDGGSSDGTLDLIGAHRTSHPFHWISEPDDGMYDAINKGISLANGDVLAYLNSDDLYLPWSVDVAVRALQRGVELIYGDLAVFQAGANGRPHTFYIDFYPNFTMSYYSFVGVLGQPTVFWRRSLTERIGLFDVRYSLIADCEYWLRAALGGAKLKHIPEVMAVQVEHQGTLRATHQTRLGEEFETLRRTMMTEVDPPNSLRWERLKRSLAWRTRQLEFLWGMKTKSPRKWGHFVNELLNHDFDVGLGDLRLLAPARWRGSATLLGDARRVAATLGVAEQQ